MVWVAANITHTIPYICKKKPIYLLLKGLGLPSQPQKYIE